MRGVTVSNIFSAGEEGAKKLTSFKMEHDKAVSWQQELSRECPSRPSSGLPGSGEQRTVPISYSPGLPYAPNSPGCPNITNMWPRKQSTQWLYLYHSALYLVLQSLSTEHPAPPLLLPHEFGISQSHFSGYSKTALLPQAEPHLAWKKMPVSCPGFAALTMRFFCLQQLLGRGKLFGCVTSGC